MSPLNDSSRYFGHWEAARGRQRNSCETLCRTKMPMIDAGMGGEMTRAGGSRYNFRALAAFGGVVILGAAVIGAGVLVKPPAASAVPSFARQTGQPCATCHTAFPELT